MRPEPLNGEAAAAPTEVTAGSSRPLPAVDKETTVPPALSGHDPQIADQYKLGRKLIEQCLSLMEVMRVVVVDDVYATAEGGAADVSRALEAGEIALKDLFAFPELLAVFAQETGATPEQLVSGEVEVDGPSDLLLSRWEDVPSSVRKDVLAAVVRSRKTEEGGDEDKVAALHLPALLPAGVELITLGLYEWTSQREVLLASGVPTLVFFDQDFTLEGGGRAEGELLLAEVVRQQLPQVFTGLLTHQVTAQNERDEWRQMCGRQGLDDPLANRALWVSKNRIESDPIGFARMMKLILLGAVFEELREVATQSLNEAVTTAFNELQELDVFDLEHALVESQGSEGTWAPEVLIRLASAWMTGRAEVSLRKEPVAHKANARLRKLSAVKVPYPGIPTARLRALQRLEWYEDAEALAAAHLPLEPGDIFRLEDPSTIETYLSSGDFPPPAFTPGAQLRIVLAQDCDIAVRLDGSRSYENIETLVDCAKVKMTTQAPDSGFALELLGPSECPFGRVCFRPALHLPMLALDLAVLHPFGLATVALADDPPTVLSDAWTKRHARVLKTVRKRLGAYSQCLPGSVALPERTLVLLAESVTEATSCNGLSAKVTTEPPRLTYGLRRVGRLRESKRLALVAAYRGHQARIAHDLAFVAAGEGTIEENAL